MKANNTKTCPNCASVPELILHILPLYKLKGINIFFIRIIIFLSNDRETKLFTVFDNFFNMNSNISFKPF